MDNNKMEVHCLVWINSSGLSIPEKTACYTNRARAEKHLEVANKNRKVFHRLFGHRWILKTLIVKIGPKEVKNG